MCHDQPAPRLAAQLARPGRKFKGSRVGGELMGEIGPIRRRVCCVCMHARALHADWLKPVHFARLGGGGQSAESVAKRGREQAGWNFAMGQDYWGPNWPDCLCARPNAAQPHQAAGDQSKRRPAAAAPVGRTCAQIGRRHNGAAITMTMASGAAPRLESACRRRWQQAQRARSGRAAAAVGGQWRLLAGAACRWAKTSSSQSWPIARSSGE